MADTPSPQKPERKPEQYTPPAKSSSSDADKSSHPASSKSGRSAASKAEHALPKLMAVTITLDAESAEVVRVEGVDTTGARRELSDKEKARLMNEVQHPERLVEVVQHAFEAGIASVLGDDEEEETTEESPEDAALRRELLAPLLERSAVRRLTERAALNRAILGTLIEHSIK